MICLHIMLFEYHRIIEHPHVELFLNNLINLVGEDIELGNRALSHVSTRNARRSNLVDFFDLRVAGVQFGEEMIEYKEIIKGSRRYEVKDTVVLEKVRGFFTDVLYSFEHGSFTHYKIPHKFQKTSKRVRKEGKQLILVLLGGTVETKETAEASRHLMAVPYGGAYEWNYFLKGATKALFSKKWSVFSKLNRETLELSLKIAHATWPQS